jgi:tryptophan halogenase
MKICIIGGGTAGWWCAAYMNKFLDADITLIESDDIPISGVGESTLPQIKTFFDELEIPEEKWMNLSNSIYKYGNIKHDWNHIGSKPFQMTFWQNHPEGRFDQWYEQYKLGNKKKEDHIELYDKNNLGYHLDANQANNIVKEQCKNVNHIVQTLTELPQGYDLYVDATGFDRKFTTNTEEIKCEHNLVNSAWVSSLEIEEISPYTKSIARPEGWQFIIDLQNRTGTGYVYSSDYVSDNEALIKFKSWNCNRKMISEPKLIKWRPNILKNPWTDNVVTIGLGQGFIDPLESNGLYLIVFSITMLVKCLLKGSSPEAYNRTVRKVQQNNSNYILHHYMLTQRDDTPFWKYYKNLDVAESVWQNFYNNPNQYTSLYPDAIWAQLGLYFDIPKP